MDAIAMLVLFILSKLRRLAPAVLRLLVVGAGTVVFLPMVVLGAIATVIWRWVAARRPLGRGWLVAITLLAGVQYVATGWLMGADPLLLYLTVHLSLLGVALLELLGHPAWPFWQPEMYLAAVPAVGPGALVAAVAITHWRWILSRPAPLAVREAQGIDVPRWVADRAQRGVLAPPDGWAIGYRRDGRPVSVSDAEARHHTLICGTPGSGKTTVLRQILEGVARRCPVVVVDCKASTNLREAVEAIPGSVVWTLGGDVRWDALRGDPTSLANKLLAAESYTAPAAIYRAAAERYIQWVATVLDLSGAPRDPAFIKDHLPPPALRRLIRQAWARQGVGAPPKLQEIVQSLSDMGRAEEEGVSGFVARFGSYVEGEAGRSLGTGPDALVLEDAIRQGRTVLFSLNAAEYGHAAAKTGAWILLDLIRVAGRLQAERWGDRRQCYVLIDEFSGLKEEGRHVVSVLARGREAGFGCVLATQGLADLRAAGPTVEQQAVQNTAIKILLRQGSAEDSDRWARHLGQFEREELSRQVDDRGASAGRHYVRWRSDFYVSPDELRVLGTGEAVVAVAPLGRSSRRLDWVRVAQPQSHQG